MTFAGVISLKYEDADILAFISDKSKKGPASPISSGAGGDSRAEINSGVEGSMSFKQIPEMESLEIKTNY